jgi:hypothetical protein
VTDIPTSSFALRWSGRWEPRGPSAVSGSIPNIEIEAYVLA